MRVAPHVKLLRRATDVDRDRLERELRLACRLGGGGLLGLGRRSGVEAKPNFSLSLTTLLLSPACSLKMPCESHQASAAPAMPPLEAVVWSIARRLAAQNRRRSSPPATEGRPADDNGARPDRSERRYLEPGAVGRSHRCRRARGLAAIEQRRDAVDQRQARERASIVAPAQPSPAAIEKRTKRHAADGTPVMAWHDLIAQLGTLTINEVALPLGERRTIQMLARPTVLQEQAFALLGVPLPRVQ